MVEAFDVFERMSPRIVKTRGERLATIVHFDTQFSKSAFACEQTADVRLELQIWKLPGREVKYSSKYEVPNMQQRSIRSSLEAEECSGRLMAGSETECCPRVEYHARLFIDVPRNQEELRVNLN